MKPTNLILSIVSSFIIFCCDYKQSNQETQLNTERHTDDEINDTSVFKTYMKNRFTIKNLDNNHYYIIIPDLGCSSCITKSLLYISNKQHCKNVSLVTSNSIKKIPIKHQKQIALATSRVYADTTYNGSNDLDKINFPFNSFTGIIYINDGKEQYIPFDYTNYQKTIDRYFCNFSKTLK